MMRLNTALMPVKGHIMACFQDALIFEEYTIDSQGIHFPGSQLLQSACPFECHCFDDALEYRSFIDQREQKLIERQFTQLEEAQMEPELLKEEIVWIQERLWKTKDRPRRLRLIYRYLYTPYDTLAMQNYRIAGVVE